MTVSVGENKPELSTNEKGILVCTALLQDCDPKDPERPVLLHDLAVMLVRRYQEHNMKNDLHLAIDLHLESLELRPVGHPDRHSSLNDTAQALMVRFQAFHLREDLESAIIYFTEALAVRSTDRFLALSNLANVLITSYEETGFIQDLEDSIRYFREAISIMPSNFPDRGPMYPSRASLLSDTADALHTLYNRLNEMKDLEEALSLHREALKFRPHGHPLRSISLNGIANALVARFGRLGKMEDLDHAIGLYRKTLALRHTGHPMRAKSLLHLSRSLRIRYEVKTDRQDLDEAIAFGREAVQLEPRTDPDRPGALMALSLALQSRFEQFGATEDLNEVIALQREAVFLRSRTHISFSGILHSLGNSLMLRFNRFEDEDDLSEAIALHEEALSLRPVGDPERSASLASCAAALNTRFEKLGEMEDLEIAIDYYAEALNLVPGKEQRRSVLLNNAAWAYFYRSDKLGSGPDRDRAVGYFREALDLRPVGHPSRSASLSSMASVLWNQGQKPQAIKMVDEAIRHHQSSAIVRLSIALFWMPRLHKEESGLGIMSYTLDLLDYFLAVSPDVERQQRFLAHQPALSTLASDAAAMAFNAGKVELAVELFERGRNLILSRLRGHRTEWKELTGSLKEKFDKVSSKLEEAAVKSTRPDSTLCDDREVTEEMRLDQLLKSHKKLMDEWGAVVADIRGVAGLTHFLKATPYDQLRAAASEGPVILVNSSQIRSDAVIIVSNGAPIHIPLLGAVWEEGPALFNSLRKAIKADQANQVRVELVKLWHLVVGPITEKLEKVTLSKKSRIWWCPSGVLSLLPLHAAGVYQKSYRNFHDMFVSSYTPTLTSLLRSRQEANQDTLSLGYPRRLLVVGNPGVPQLKSVEKEIRHIKDVKYLNNTILVGESATPAVALRELEFARWAHFSCHGDTNLENPFLSSFQLHNKRPLTLQEIMGARLPHAEFAFLSACHSAASDKRTPDECINLAAALHCSGFRSVVGTLWEMYDDDGPEVVKDFYAELMRRGADYRDSALALHQAVKKLKKRGVSECHWVQFVHVGV